MGKAKRTLSVIMAALMLVFTCMTYVPASAAENTAADPAIGLVGIGHSPLVVGDTEEFSFTANNADKVQYKLILKDPKGTVVEDVTNGYTAAVDAKTPYVVKAKTVFALGMYSATLYIKRTSDNKEISYPFALNCVTADNNNRIYANGDMVIDKTTAVVGEKVTISGLKNIGGIVGPYKYRLHLYNTTTGQWEKNVVGTYGDNVVWTPSAAGTYVLDVHVNSEKSTTWAKYLANPTSTDLYGTYEAWKLQTVTVNPKPVNLQVESVSAINAKEIKVVFNKEVNYTSAVNSNNYTVTGATVDNANVTLLDDGKSVILPLTSTFANGNSYKVNVAGVMDTAYQTMTAYTDSIKMFSDFAAPQLLSAKYVSGTVKLTFDEPVTNSMTVKVDGVVIADGATTFVTPSTTPGDYTAVTPAVSLAAGNHTVTVYSVNDKLANPNTNTLAVASTTFAVATDNAAPSVVGLTAKSFNTFKVQFSEALGATLTNANLVVVKGGHTYTAGTDFNVVGLDSTDATNSTWLVRMEDIDANNPLYGTDQTSVTLNVTVKNYKDTSALYGAIYTGNVALSSDAAAPYVLSSNLNVASGSTLRIKFNEALDTTVAVSKITVLKDNIIMPATSAQLYAGDATNKTLEITLNAATVSGVYTVILQPGAVTDVSYNDNAAITTTVDNTAAVGALQPGTFTAAGNVITIDYGVAMSTSAANLANYTIDGLAFPAGTSIGFYGDNETVKITLPSGYFPVNTTALVVISKDVTNLAGTSTVKTNTGANVSSLLSFVDNIKPVLASAKFVLANAGDVTTSVIRLTFNENMTFAQNVAITDFAAYVNGVKINVTAHTAVTNAKTIDITLATPINISQAVTVKVLPVSTTNTAIEALDANSNALTTGTIVNVAQ